ncbi:MAG TPA: GNAT family protein [Victivallales bacterium]|nr:GNAT family protein [Victivallales bacterium]
MIEMILKDNITIKMIEMRQSQEMYDFIMKNKEFFINWIPFVSKIQTLEDMDKFIQNNLDRYMQGIGIYYTLWDNSKIIGYVLVREIDNDAKWAEIGYMVDQDYTGKGIVKAFTTKIITYLFDSLKMNKIVICCDENNKNSQALPKKFGFTLEGTIRNHIVVNGTVRNTLHYGLLKDEYK